MRARGCTRLAVSGPAVLVVGVVALVGIQPVASRSVGAVRGGVAPAQEAPGRASKIHPAVWRAFGASDPGRWAKVWVLLEQEKGLSTAAARAVALEQLAQTYDRKSIERRGLRRVRPGMFDLDDLPIPQAYVDGVAATGAKVLIRSRWINAVSVSATRAQVEQIAALSFVEKIQPVRWGRGVDPAERHFGEVSSGTPDSEIGSAAGTFYGQSEAQLVQINLAALHAQGFTGTGVRVGILDTGFQRTHVAFHEPGHELSVVAEYDFVSNDPDTSIQVGDAPDQHSHGTAILGVLGAYKPGELVGGAYDASFILCKTEDVTSETPVEEDNYVAGLEFIESHGGDMATASLGYIDWYTQADLDGMTAVTTIAVNVATANGLHCCNAAGNGGHDANPATSNLIAPSDATRVNTCGAVNAAGDIASFSSDGPSADGRTKPELLALGLNTRSVDPFNDTGFGGFAGTSLSTPVVASAVACLIQAHPDWTVDQMRWYLLHTAGDYVLNHAPDPLFVRGYGILDAASAAVGDCNGNLVPDATDISGGASQDCNANGIPDECEIAVDASIDLNGNGVPDVCDGPSIPTVSAWGLIVILVMLVSVGAIVTSRRPHLDGGVPTTR